MKLYNRTRCPDEILKPLLRTAAMAARVPRTSGVVVLVNSGRYGSGEGAPACLVSISSRGRDDRWVKTDKAYIRLVFPLWSITHPSYDRMVVSEDWWSLCVHEWAHVRDIQKGRRFGDYNLRWANRPHEVRARYTEREAKQNRTARAESAILALAVWAEEQVQWPREWIEATGGKPWRHH